MIREEETHLSESLLALELRLIDPAFRGDREGAATLLSEQFREFGSSGRLWTRETILEMMTSEGAYTPPELKDFAVMRLGPDAALVTYRAVGQAFVGAVERETLRSSIWVFSEGRWQMLFHQGTSVPNS